VLHKKVAGLPSVLNKRGCRSAFSTVQFYSLQDFLLCCTRRDAGLPSALQRTRGQEVLQVYFQCCREDLQVFLQCWKNGFAGLFKCCTRGLAYLSSLLNKGDHRSYFSSAQERVEDLPLILY